MNDHQFDPLWSRSKFYCIQSEIEFEQVSRSTPIGNVIVVIELPHMFSIFTTSIQQ